MVDELKADLFLEKRECGYCLAEMGEDIREEEDFICLKHRYASGGGNKQRFCFKQKKLDNHFISNAVKKNF